MRSYGTFVFATLLLTLGCSGDDGDVGVPDGPGLSVVAMGDSVSAGEGTRYGFEYVDEIQTWVGPTDFNPDWDGDFSACHQAGSAYPNKAVDAIDGALAKFSCTGGTYDNGIRAAQVEDGFTRRTAQFGDWTTGEELNGAYDEAEPEVVLITLGANDLQWADILAACILGSVLGDEVERAIGEGGDLGDAVEVVIETQRDRILDFFAALPSTGPDGGQQPAEGRVCTAENPGTAIERFFLAGLPTLRENYAQLIADIQARGEQAGRVPRIVLTTYHDPFPPAGGRFGCPDLLGLNESQVAYLRTLLDQLSNVILETAAANDGVDAVDIRGAMAGHEFCTSDPWTYGLSIQIVNPGNPAPFHPTPDGHQAISDLVVPALTP